jgi:hypothetical protein
VEDKMFGEGMKYRSPDSLGEKEGEAKLNRINVVQECDANEAK